MMATRAISRPSERHRPYQHDRPPVRVVNSPRAWFMFLCDRCNKPFRVQGRIARHCILCLVGADRFGITGMETLGEAGTG